MPASLLLALLCSYGAVFLLGMFIGMTEPARKEAKNINCESLLIVGYDGGKSKSLADYTVHIPSWDMQICEDMHLSFGHLVMKSICSKDIKPIYESVGFRMFRICS